MKLEPHEPKTGICINCTPMTGHPDEWERREMEVDHYEISCGGRMGRRPQVFEHWECQNCGEVQLR